MYFILYSWQLWLKILVDSESTYTEIDKQWVKGEKKLINRSFKVFNANRTKNGEVMRYVLLELEINRYIKKIDTVVINLNSTDMFLEYN